MTIIINKSVSVDVDVDVDVNPTDFSDDELIEEIEKRGYTVSGKQHSNDWQTLADAFHFNRNPRQVLDDLIYTNTGRIIDSRAP